MIRFQNFKNVQRAVLALFAIGALVGLSEAQSYYGALRGAIVDQNGGAVPNAKVTLTNQGTAATRTALSATGGEFVFSEVIPATYTLSAESPGFKKFERKIFSRKRRIRDTSAIPISRRPEGSPAARSNTPAKSMKTLLAGGALV